MSNRTSIEKMLRRLNVFAKRATRVTRPFPLLHDLPCQNSILEHLPQKNLNFQRQLCIPNPFIATSTKRSLQPFIHGLSRILSILNGLTHLAQLGYKLLTIRRNGWCSYAIYYLKRSAPQGCLEGRMTWNLFFQQHIYHQFDGMRACRNADKCCKHMLKTAMNLLLIKQKSVNQ